MRKILVTGANGLYGSAVQQIFVNCRKADDQILYVTREICDLQNRESVFKLFHEFQPTHVIHLAAMVGGLLFNMERNLEFFERNVIINLNVLGACARTISVVKVISCMSTCIFPDNADLPLTVDQLHAGLPHQSNLGYSFAKRMIDVENRILHRDGDPSSSEVHKRRRVYTAIIPTNMFGPGDNFDPNTSMCYLR